MLQQVPKRSKLSPNMNVVQLQLVLKYLSFSIFFSFFKEDNNLKVFVDALAKKLEIEIVAK